MKNEEAAQHLRAILAERSPVQVGIFRRTAIAKAIRALEHSPEIPEDAIGITIVQKKAIRALECDTCHARQDPAHTAVCNCCGSTELKAVYE